MRILLVTSAYYPYPSGVSEHVHHQANELQALGHSVSILTTHYKLGIEDKVETNIPVERFGHAILIPGNMSFATLPVGLRMPFQVRNHLKENLDIIHMHGVFPPEIGFWALHYSRTVNVATFLTYSEKGPFLPTTLIHKIFRNYIKKLNGKIAISNACKSSIERYIPGDYRVIPSGVDINRFSPENEPLEEFKDFDCPILLFLGRLDKRKGLTVILKALPVVLKEFGKLKLVVVGRGPELSSAKKMVKELGIEGAVLFKGYVSKQALPRYYASCQIFISPALGGEALGIVLLEAMASGKSVIASNIAGYNEVISDGNNGILFPVGDHQALAQQIIMVLDKQDLRGCLEKNGRATSLAYSWKEVARRVEYYYYELLR